MALRYFTGFDLVNDISQVGIVPYTGSGYYITTTGPRTGTRCITNGGGGFNALKLDQQSTWIVGMALKAVGAQVIKVVSLTYGTPSAPSYGQAANTQVLLLLQSDFRLHAYRCYGNNYETGTIIGSTAVPVIPNNSYCFLEVKVVVASGTGGSFIVRVNGSTVLNLTGVNTYYTGIPDFIGFGGASNSAGGFIDDLYICDGTGSAPYNDFLGDQQITAQVPTGDGNYMEWARSSGASAYNLVDEIPPSEADYVYATAIGKRETYTFPATGLGASDVNAVKVSIIGHSDDANRQIKGICRYSGTDSLTTDAVSVGTFTADYGPIFTTNPITGAAWHHEEIDAYEFGHYLNS